MIVRFENLLSKRSFTKNYSHEQLKTLESRSLWSVDDTVYWIVNIIPFDGHYSIFINPLYAWEKIAENGDWSIFDTVMKDEIYAEKVTDRLCLRHENSEPGISDKSGNAIYLKIYKFDLMPRIKIGDVFIFDNVAYIAKSFEIHRRVAGKKVMDRVIVVTHDPSALLPKDHTSIVSNEYITNPLNYFLGGFEDVNR